MKLRRKPSAVRAGKKRSLPIPREKMAAGQCLVSAEIEICILAGGLSSRMGRDKSKLRLSGQTLLAHIRGTAKKLGFPVRVIRRDYVPRCGPLGGIYTALKSTSAKTILFLACDMPRVSEPLLKRVLGMAGSLNTAVFTIYAGLAGFPLVLKRSALPTIERQMAEQQFSLQTLSQLIEATLCCPSRRLRSDLLNVNTPGDWSELKKAFAKTNRLGRRLDKRSKAAPK